MRKRKPLQRFLLLVLAFACAAGSLSACKRKGMDATTLFADTEGLIVTENSVSFPEPLTARLFAESTAEAGFAVSYTVQSDNPEYTWIGAGGLYVELDGFEVDTDDDGVPDGNLWHNLVVYQDPKQSTRDAFACLHIIEKGVFAEQDRNEGAEYVTTLPFSVASNPIDVSIAYYDAAYYIMLDRTYKVKLTADLAYAQTNKTLYLNEFFAPRTRKIGFRSTNTPATFSTINVAIGDEAAREAIRDMGLD